MGSVEVSDLLETKNDNARIDIARRIGKILSVDDLPDVERKAAEVLARDLVADAVERVRRELSQAVAEARYLARDIAMKIAHDVDSIACPFLQVTEVFTDEDWQRLVLTISCGARIAAAERKSMSEGLALVLAEVGEAKVAEALVANGAAPMTSRICGTLMDRFDSKSQVLDKLAERGDLREEIVASLIVKASAAARKKLEASYELPNHTAVVAAEAEVAAIVRLIRETPEIRQGALAEQLRQRERLSHRLLLTALQEGLLYFFEAAMSSLASLTLRQVKSATREGGIDSLAKLLDTAKFPRAAYDDVWEALQKIRLQMQS